MVISSIRYGLRSALESMSRRRGAVLVCLIGVACGGNGQTAAQVPSATPVSTASGIQATEDSESPLAVGSLTSLRGYTYEGRLETVEVTTDEGDPGYTFVKIVAFPTIKNTTPRDSSAPRSLFGIRLYYDLGELGLEAGRLPDGYFLFSSSQCMTILGRREIDGKTHCAPKITGNTLFALGRDESQTIRLEATIGAVRDADVNRALDVLAQPDYVTFDVLEQDALEGRQTELVPIRDR